MENLINSPAKDFVLNIKKELKEECLSIDVNCRDEPLRSLVLRFVRDKNGTYSVIPLIKPDPFFEENLDDFCHEDKYSLIKTEEPDKKEPIICETDNDNNNAIKQTAVKENNATKATVKVKGIKKNTLSQNKRITSCTKCIYTNFELKVKRHLQRVHAAQRHPCHFCSSQKDFKELISLETHILLNHAHITDAMSLIKRNIFSCDFCRYRSLKRSNFTRHLTTHGNNKLKNRLKKQEEENKRFVVRNESKYEIKMALRKTTFNCYHCSYNTKEKGSIIKHVRLHKSSNHMPFLCKACNRTFNEKNSLDSHIVKRHLDDRELLKSVTNRVHECELCSYKDVNKNKVIRHKKARHVKKEKKKINKKKINKFVKV